MMKSATSSAAAAALLSTVLWIHPVDAAPPAGKALVVGGVKVTLGTPMSRLNLAVFPLNSPEGAQSSENYLTLEEALKANVLVVQELPQKEVNRVRVTSTTGRPIYLLAGDIILGGQQDREVAHDTIIPSYAKDFIVDVFCVEHGRWEGAQHFDTSEVASASLRYQTQGRKDQSQVWSKVAQDTRSLGAETNSGTYRAVARKADLQRQIADYSTAVQNSLRNSSKVVGMVVSINGKVVGADVFSSHKLFSKELAKLLKSYSLDAAAQKAVWEKSPRKPAPSRIDAIQLLEDSNKGKRRTTGTTPNTVNQEVENANTYDFMARPAASPNTPALHSNIYRKGAGLDSQDEEPANSRSHRQYYPHENAAPNAPNTPNQAVQR